MTYSSERPCNTHSEGSAVIVPATLVPDALPNATFMLRGGYATAGFFRDLVTGGTEVIGLSIQEAGELADQLFAYFRAKAEEPNVPHVPSQLIDLLWDIARKHPEYPVFCRLLTGDIIVHNVVGADAIGNLAVAVASTVERFRLHRIPVITRWWVVTDEDEVGCNDSNRR